MTQQPPTPAQYPEASQATTALVLGILGVIGCLITAPFAWYISGKELAAINQGRRDPTGRGVANAGKILGIIGTVFLVIAVAFFVVVPLVVLVAGTEVSETFSEIASSLDG